MTFTDRMKLADAIDELRKSSRLFRAAGSDECVGFAQQIDAILFSGNGPCELLLAEEQAALAEELIRSAG